MNKLPAILVLIATALPVVLSAAVPLRWTVETSRLQPAQFEAFHGETIELAAAMQSYGKPLAITNDLIGIYWQTNGMGSAYWAAPAVLSNNVMTARWTPSMDVGANVYSCFIGAPGDIYRAAFQLRLRPSPGAVPSELPLPVKTLDFAQVTVLNAPYYSKSETDAKIIELAPAPGNYATISNRAMTAVQPTAISDMETQTHAAATYQPKGSYLTSESDPTVYPWAKATSKPSYSGSEISLTGVPGDTVQGFAKQADMMLATMPSTSTPILSLNDGNIASGSRSTILSELYISGEKVATESVIEAHDKSETAHTDIRQSVSAKYSKPSSGIPKTDLASAVQTSLGKADSALQAAHNTSTNAHTDIRAALSDKQDVIADLNTIRSGASLGATAVQPSTISDMETKTHAAATYQPKGSYLTFESDPTVDGKISTHNSSSSAHADIRNTVNNLADNVSTWSSYWSGDDVRVTVTNYDSAVNLPSLYLEYKLSNGTFRTVWDERTRWDINDRRMAAVESAVEGKADRAWGYYDSHTGGWAPDGYTWLSSPKIAISGGMAYQKHVTSEGAVWVLESNGLIAESGGVMSNGFFRISDDEGNPLFEIVKGDKRTVGATAGSCEPLAGYAITHLQIGYAVESADHPKIYVTRSLTPVDWKDEEDADCPATVNWSGSSGNWTAVVAGKVAEAQLFVKAEYEVGGNTYIKQSAPVSVQKLVLGGQEYRVGTATISGHTVLTLTLEP